MISFENSTPELKTNMQIQNNNFAILLFIFVFIVSLYTIIKFSSYFPKSIRYTKKAMGNKLKFPFVYGLKWSTASVINLIILEVLLLAISIWTAVNFANEVIGYPKLVEETKQLGQTIDENFNFLSVKSIVNYFMMALPILFIIGVFSYNFYKFKKSFNEEQYQNKSYIPELKKELIEEFKNDLSFGEIKINLESMKTKNLLGSKVLAKKINIYNNLENLNFKKAYKFALEMEFISNYYEFYVKNFTFFGNYFNKENENSNQINYLDDYSSTIENQIKWMFESDKIKSNNVSEPVEQNNSNIFNYRNVNMTLLKNQRKNTNLLANTSDINYLGVDPSIKLDILVNDQIHSEKDVLETIQLLTKNTWKKLISMM